MAIGITETATGLKTNEAITLVELDGSEDMYRVHHIRFAGWAMKYGDLAADSPESLARTFAAKVKGWLNSPSFFASTYARTTVHLNGQDTSELYINALGSGLRELIDADEEREFVVVEDMPDLVCKKMRACGLDDHCSRRTIKLMNGAVVPNLEKYDMDVFLRAVKDFGVIPEVQHTLAKYVDAPPAVVRMVKLKAGVIRDIIQFMANSEKYKDFFEDQELEV